MNMPRGQYKKHFDIKPKYFQNLPRVVEGTERCQVLLANGDRCPNEGSIEVSATLDSKMYIGDVSWIAFKVCRHHYGSEELLRK